jgi:hypothetical protein
MLDRVAVLVLLALVIAGAAGEVRVGDADSVLVEDLLDPAWPAMRGWAMAGVRGGIPARSDAVVHAQARPGDDLQALITQAALAAAEAETSRVVLLTPGTYLLPARLDLASGVILRGEDPERVILEVTQRVAQRWERELVGLRMLECRRAGLEDLTVVHPAVRDLDPKMYRNLANDHQEIADLHVGHLFIGLSEDCWVQNCRLLYSGTDPVVVNNSRHITLRDNQVKWCFNKGGGGNGYYLIHKSQQVLCFNEEIEGLRHVVIQTQSLGNVLLDCRITGDFNYHAGDGGGNLVEGCVIRRPKGHYWGPIGFWKTPRGEGNIFWNNEVGGRYCQDSPFQAGVPARMSTGLEGAGTPAVIPVTEVPPPRGGTLYPMSGLRWSKSGGTADAVGRDLGGQEVAADAGSHAGILPGPLPAQAADPGQPPRSIAAGRDWTARRRSRSNFGARSKASRPFCSWKTSVNWV